MRQVVVAVLTLILLCGSAFAASPTVQIAPATINVDNGGSVLFTAYMSDGSQIVTCWGWAQSGSPTYNQITQMSNPAQATFAVSQNAPPANYIISVTCKNVSGVTGVGFAIATVP